MTQRIGFYAGLLQRLHIVSVQPQRRHEGTNIDA
jgi:hypothetical protein